jgi:uncharacterized protein (DUF1800 family)
LAKANRQAIDPAWAWSPYVPDAARPWNRARAAHLFRRAGFGAPAAAIDAAIKRAPGDVVAELVAAAGQTEAFQRESDAMARTLLATGNARNLSAWWLYRMIETPAPLLEKATLFWHGHFATGAEKVTDASLMLRQNRLLRRHALGDFAALTHEISRDAAMLLYLDSATNRKAHPNENYARELMELFCLGEGNYTEKDVQELARCFTGWEVRRDTFHFNPNHHDTGAKTVLGKTGPFGGEEAVRIVLEQPAAPRFIAAKLVRFFVFDEPAPSEALVEPLARELRDNGWNVGKLVARILGSNLFFSEEHAVGRKIRSPVDLAVGFLRALKGSTDTQMLARELEQLGQALFYPPNVKGWDGGRAWINSSTLLGRANLMRGLLLSEKTRFARGTLSQLAEQAGARTAEEKVEWLAGVFFAVPIPPDVRKDLVALAGRGEPQRALIETIHVMSTLPEFQLC